MRCQRLNQIAEQQAVINLDKPLIGPEGIGHGKLGKCIGDNCRRGLTTVQKTGKIPLCTAPTPKKKFISKQLLTAIKDRLTTKKNFLLFVVGHVCS